MKKMKSLVRVSNGVMLRVHKLKVESFGNLRLMSGELHYFHPNEVGTEVYLITSINRPLDQRLVFPD